MGEAADVLAALEAARLERRDAALATIVGVKGSTYRRPGARLLVYDSGPSIGNLSGGCLEGEVEAIAREVMQDARPRTVLYDLTADDEAVWGWGLGCNGVIEVFIEGSDAAAEIAGAMRSAIEEERSVVVATVIESSREDRLGARLLVHPDGTAEGDTSDEAGKAMFEAARGALAEGSTRTVEAAAGGDTLRIFVEVLEPPPRLLVCGAGHDAIPVVAAAAAMGWRVYVVDDRADLLDAARFPGAAGFLHTQPGELAEATALDDRTYVVVMTHNFLRDKAYLGALLGTDAAYIGMLGPEARLERLLQGLADEGIAATQGDLAKIHGPAGLDIGGEGPDEIAVAIAGELLAVRNEREAGFLRARKGPIHDRNRLQAVAP